MSPESPLISDQSSPVWPRRASKACANCRRDKIRCDGSRPCGACKKKGYQDDRCVDGCEPCRRARTRCEDGTPCRRCVEMNIHCPDSSAPIGSASQSAQPSPSLDGTQDPEGDSLSKATKAAGERAKLACANCRRDNKKCEDQRPCSRCVAREEECIHLPRGPKLVKLRCDGCRSDNKRCQETRPCQYCVDGGKECITAPRKGMGHGNRVKVACVSCRRDKVRCDGGRPCTSCIKKGCECIQRACNACFEDGKAAHCKHRKNIMVKMGDSTPPESQALYTATQAPGIHGHQRPQWISNGFGPHSHPLHPLHPSITPQPQYYFPPQPMGQYDSMHPFPKYGSPILPHPAQYLGPLGANTSTQPTSSKLRSTP